MSNKEVPERYRTNRRSQAEIAQLLEAFKTSGQTRQEFATEHRLSLSTLQWWLRRSRGGCESQEGPPQWLEVKPASAPAKSLRGPLAYQIALAGGVLSVPSGFDPEELKELLGLLGGQL